MFSGDCIPAHTQSEDCTNIIRKIVHDKLGTEISITPMDVSIAHRLGPKPNSTVDKRSIIVRFCRRKLKYEVLNKARRSKPTGLFVNESLTPTRQKITSAIRKAKKEYPGIISGYETIDGNIHMYVKPPNPAAAGAKNSRIAMNTLKKLDEFCRKSFKKPVTHFLESTKPRVATAERRSQHGN